MYIFILQIKFNYSTYMYYYRILILYHFHEENRTWKVGCLLKVFDHH